MARFWNISSKDLKQRLTNAQLGNRGQIPGQFNETYSSSTLTSDTNNTRNPAEQTAHGSEFQAFKSFAFLHQSLISSSLSSVFLPQETRTYQHNFYSTFSITDNRNAEQEALSVITSRVSCTIPVNSMPRSSVDLSPLSPADIVPDIVTLKINLNCSDN